MSFQGVDFYDTESLFTKDERAVRDTVRRWVDDEVIPIIGDHYVQGKFPLHLAPKMAELGLFGANLPEEYGCAGLNHVAYGLIMQELERGETMGCFGLTEPDFGSNPGGMITTARELADGWVLNGAKMWITNGSTAHVAIIWAKTGALDDTRSIRGFIVPTDTKGFSAKDQKGKLSLRASDTSELVLQDVKVGKDALLPKSGGVRSPLMCLTQARYGIAWGAVGAAMACFGER